jgi:hypothetical protein
MPKKTSKQSRRRKVVTVDKRATLLKPDPAADMGSLREFFEGKTSKEIIEEARREDASLA